MSVSTFEIYTVWPLDAQHLSNQSGQECFLLAQAASLYPDHRLPAGTRCVTEQWRGQLLVTLLKYFLCSSILLLEPFPSFLSLLSIPFLWVSSVLRLSLYFFPD